MTETHYGGVRMDSPYLPGARVRTPRGVGVIRWVFRCAPHPYKDMATVKLPRERWAVPFHLNELTPLEADINARGSLRRSCPPLAGLEPQGPNGKRGFSRR